MPRSSPTPIMKTFGSQFGSFQNIGSLEDMSLAPEFATAFHVFEDMMSSFVTSKNRVDDAFSYDLQIVENEEPNAVCSFLGRTCSIVVFSGLLVKIMEIAEFMVELHLITRGGEQTFDPGVVGAKYLDRGLNGQVQRLIVFHEKGVLALYYYLSNYLLLFVLRHEGHHCADGHAAYLTQQNTSLFIGEIRSAFEDDSVEQIAIAFEFDADRGASLGMIVDFISGHEYLNLNSMDLLDENNEPILAPMDIPADERLGYIWVAIILLANTWRSKAEKDTKTHPAYWKRLLNIYWSPHQLKAQLLSGGRSKEYGLLDETCLFCTYLLFWCQELDEQFSGLSRLTEPGSREQFQILSLSMNGKRVQQYRDCVSNLAFMPVSNMKFVGEEADLFSAMDFVKNSLGLHSQ